MSHIKGPAIFLAQFMRDDEPYNTIDNIGRWVAGLGYKGVQIPAWERSRHRPGQGRGIQNLL